MEEVQSPTSGRNRLVSADNTLDVLADLFSKYDNDASGFVNTVELSRLIR